MLSDHFAKANSSKERALLADHFGSERSTKERGALADHFGSERNTKERRALADHFSTPGASRGERKASPDHFKAGVKEKEHKEKDLYNRGARRKVLRKNFLGERFRLFNLDPNKSRKSRQKVRQKKRKKDPFSRNSIKMNRPQYPRGENGLFENGVAPKMDDPR